MVNQNFDWSSQCLASHIYTAMVSQLFAIFVGYISEWILFWDKKQIKIPFIDIDGWEGAIMSNWHSWYNLWYNGDFLYSRIQKIQIYICIHISQYTNMLQRPLSERDCDEDGNAGPSKVYMFLTWWGRSGLVLCSIATKVQKKWQTYVSALWKKVHSVCMTFPLKYTKNKKYCIGIRS